MELNVIVITDGLNGPLNQISGIAKVLSEMTGADIHALHRPLLTGLSRFRALREAAKAIQNSEASRHWLETHEGSSILSRCLALQGKKLFLASDSDSALFAVLLAKAVGGQSGALIEPSGLSLDCLDYSFLPIHKLDGQKNVDVVTLGWPNLVDFRDLKNKGRQLTLEYPPKAPKAWAVLIGGDDSIHQVSARWINELCDRILRRAEKENACLYVSTSPRTSAEAKEALINRLEGHRRVAALIFAEQGRSNPVQGMLGCCDVAFVTNDSISMISEVATSGVPMAVLPVGKKWNLRRIFERLCSTVADLGFETAKRWRGYQRRNVESLEEFCAVGLAKVVYLDQLSSVDLSLKSLRPRGDVQFNEAKRVARWLKEHWLKEVK